MEFNIKEHWKKIQNFNFHSSGMVLIRGCPEIRLSCLWSPERKEQYLTVTHICVIFLMLNFDVKLSVIAVIILEIY